jgi:outer membrane protein
MKRNQWMTVTIVVLTLSALASRPAWAQVSEKRIRELMREAAELATAAPQPPVVRAPGEGPTLALTLDDAVNLALERNLDIAVQRLNPQLQDIAIASALAFYNPSLTSTFARAAATGTPSNQLQLSSGGKGVTQNQLAVNGGIVQNFRWGGASLAATLNNGRFQSDSNNALFNPQFNSNWTAVFSQPLMRGFRIDAQRRQLQITAVNRSISEVQVRAAVTNTVSNVRNAYWDYVYTTQAVEVARQSLDLAAKLVQDNQTRVEIGTMAPIDVVQAQAEQATRRQALVNAENDRRTAELGLKRLIVSGTEDPTWSATLDPVERPEFRPEPVDLEGAIRRALSERTDLAIVKKTVENNTTTLRYLRDQTLPDVEAQVTYGLQGIGGVQQIRSNSGVLGSDVKQVIPGGIFDSFRTLFDRNYPRWTLALNMSYPLGTSTQEAAVARARVQLSQVGAEIKQIELQVATEVTNAGIQLRNAAEAVEAAQVAQDLSQRRLEAEQSKFEVGMSTNYFVVQAQRDMNEARNSELRAVLNYRKALVEFERLQQTTLQSSNITVLQGGGGGGDATATQGGSGGGGANVALPNGGGGGGGGGNLLGR